MNEQTRQEIREDFRMIDLPGLIHHPDGTKDFRPRWSEWQIRELRRLKATTNLSNARIGAKIGKSKFAVWHKWNDLKARNHE